MMILFETSGIFDPADYGLAVGDVLNVICVQGGQSGGPYASGDCADGGVSAFGSYASSDTGAVMGKGGTYKRSSTSGVSEGGCGAGGYLPGVPLFGGNGSDAAGTISVSGLAGCAKTVSAYLSPYCNPSGDGNKGATTASSEDATTASGAAGNGYGAGGGGIAMDKNWAGKGGDAGKLSFTTVVLENMDSIPVTVGTGGVLTSNSYGSGKGAPGVVIVTW